jgi:16S rRNA (uracil1498-N3)-methyltransferase
MEITVLDNSGWEYTVHLDAVERHLVAGTVAGRQLAAGEPRLKLALYVALLRGERFEWVLQKGTELGVSVFVPVVCERSVVDDAAEIGAAKIERWERIIREAAEQSRRGRLPKLQPAHLFAPACEHATRRAPALLLWEGSGGSSLRGLLRTLLPPPTQFAPLSIAAFSGPEGGWTEAEVSTAIRYNIQLASLGARTLRAETAPIAAATIMLYEHGDLD